MRRKGGEEGLLRHLQEEGKKSFLESKEGRSNFVRELKKKKKKMYLEGKRSERDVSLIPPGQERLYASGFLGKGGKGKRQLFERLRGAGKRSKIGGKKGEIFPFAIWRRMRKREGGGHASVRAKIGSLSSSWEKDVTKEREDAGE